MVGLSVSDHTDISIYIAPGVAGAVLWFLRWAVGLWATIRREDIDAVRINAIAQREADIRTVDRQVAAIDRIARSVEEHTVKDLAHHAEVKEAVVRLDAKMSAWSAPVEIPPEHSSERRRKAVRAATEPR